MLEDLDAGGVKALPGLAQLEGDGLGADVVTAQGGDAAVKDDVAMVDDHGPLAEHLDVAGIVGGQKDGDLLLLVHLQDKVADALLDDDVEADGGLVEEEDLGPVEQGGGDLAAHALAQGQFTHRGLQVVADVE